MLIILKSIASIFATVLIMCLEWPLAKVSDKLYFYTRGPLRMVWLRILLNRLLRMHLRRMNRDIIALALATDTDMSSFLMEINRLELHYSKGL